MACSNRWSSHTMQSCLLRISSVLRAWANQASSLTAEVSCFDQTGCRDAARMSSFLDGTELSSKTFSTLHRSPLPVQGFVWVSHGRWVSLTIAVADTVVYIPGWASSATTGSLLSAVLHDKPPLKEDE